MYNEFIYDSVGMPLEDMNVQTDRVCTLRFSMVFIFYAHIQLRS